MAGRLAASRNPGMSRTRALGVSSPGVERFIRSAPLANSIELAQVPGVVSSQHWHDAVPVDVCDSSEQRIREADRSVYEDCFTPGRRPRVPRLEFSRRVRQQQHYAGLDVSLDTTAICVLDAKGAVVWRGKCASAPEAIRDALRQHAPALVRAGLETGQLSNIPVSAVRAASSYS